VNAELEAEIRDDARELADLQASISDDARQAAQERQDFERDFTYNALINGKQREDLYQEEHDQFVALVTDQYNRGIISSKAYQDAVKDADIKVIQDMEKVDKKVDESKLRIQSMEDISRNAAESFASGMSGAFVDFVSGTKSASEAFKQFAAQFLQQVAQMIIQMLILRAIKAGFGSYFADGGVAMAAGGGMFPTYAANGLAGVGSVSSATYFPKFNVVAGEAGREMLTVLAKPRMMEIGGMQAVVGNAGGNRLAITSADDLQGRGGAGGRIVIEVRGTRDFEARIIENSVEGAAVRVAHDMQRDTPISRNTKALTA
jgi:major membrane immunogen (membrane-anchored lipoprotein)